MAGCLGASLGGRSDEGTVSCLVCGGGLVLPILASASARALKGHGNQWFFLTSLSWPCVGPGSQPGSKFRGSGMWTRGRAWWRGRGEAALMDRRALRPWCRLCARLCALSTSSGALCLLLLLETRGSVRDIHARDGGAGP